MNDKNGGFDKVKTGTSIYRIGGDEFALISNTETYDVPLKINYGVTIRRNQGTFSELYVNADILLTDNKNDTYRELGLNRRK